MVPWLTELRLATLREYSMDAYLQDQGLSPAAVQSELARLAHLWSVGFHPWSLVSLGQAMSVFGVAERLQRIRAKVLLALCDNDKLFPARDSPRVMALMREAGIEARYVEIASRYGHLASGIDWSLWAGPLREFMQA
jgi:homoserine O-acetyltransferase